MKFNPTLTLLFLVTIGCSQAQNNDNKDVARSEIVEKSIKYLDTDRTFARVKLPASWQLFTDAELGEPILAGENGLEVRVISSKNYYHSADSLEQIYLGEQGLAISAPIGLEALVATEVLPEITTKKQTILRSYDLQLIGENMTGYAAAFANTDSIKYRAKAIECSSLSDFRSLYILTYGRSEQGSFTTWSYELKELKAQTIDFDWAVEKYLDGLSTVRYNPNLINESNLLAIGDVGSAVDSWIEDEKLLGLKGEALEAEQRRQAERRYQYYQYSERDSTWD